MKIVGKQMVDYVSKKTNQPVKGVSLHCVGARNDVEGESVETIFVSARSAMYESVISMPLGTSILVSYNRWGSPENVQACK